MQSLHDSSDGSVAAQEVTLYWIPGCGNCTRMKGYLTQRGVEFRSVNVMHDLDAVEDMKKVGISTFPVVRVGDRWATGIDMVQVDELLAWDPDPSRRELAVDEMVERVAVLLEAASGLAAALPADHYDDPTPTVADAATPFLFLRDGSPYIPHASNRGLVYHVAGHGERFKRIALAADGTYEFGFGFGFNGEDSSWGEPIEAIAMYRVVDQLVLAASDIRAWIREHPGCDGSRVVDTFYGPQTVRQLLQFYTISIAQHYRQIRSVVEALGIDQADAVVPERDFEGLVMPASIWGV